MQICVFRKFSPRVLAVTGICGGIVLLACNEGLLASLLAPWTMVTSRITLALLHWCGMEAVRMGTIISHPDGFAYEISYRCTGIIPAAAHVAWTLLYSDTLRRRMIVLAVGFPLLLGLNLIRLVHLFYVGVHEPSAFEFVHGYLWVGVFILTLLGLWLGSISVFKYQRPQSRLTGCQPGLAVRAEEGFPSLKTAP